MKLIHYIYISAALMMLSACGDDIEETPVYTVGEADNAIVLRAGVREVNTGGAQTRAGADDNHAKHVGFTTGTAVALRIDGTWTGHSPEDVKKKTVATLKAASEKHNEFDTYNPVVYWDDFGTADPANKETGRANGLSIYGAAVNGKTTLPATLSSDLDNTSDKWKALSWNVGTSTDGVVDQSNAGWADYDLLVSNNVVYSETPSADNAYKFANRADGKLLEFTHAMTKITVELTAGEGFAGYSSQDKTAAKFGTTAPTATLKGFYYTGKVDIETKTSTATAADGATSPKATTDIKMKLISGGASQNTAKFDALVFPGNLFADTDDILTFTADGNTFIVTAAKLNAAISAAISNNATTSYPGTDNTLFQAWNYTIKILVKKTDIVITATIKDWDDVEAEEETPLIRITDSYGQTGDAFGKSYDFFRSTVKAKGYDENTSVDGITYAARYDVSTEPASWDKTLYWPDHQTHYFFRGVYPVTGTAATGTGTLAGVTTPALPAEVVTTVGDNDVIAVKNAVYTADTYPSDLAIAIPRGATAGTYDETCKVEDHKRGGTAPDGICATEGTIRMNFEYAMSKVQVSLKSSGTDGADKVDLSNVKVEILGGYNKGRIKLSDGLHDGFTEADKGSYTLSQVASYKIESGYIMTTLDAIVPQSLSNDVKIRITVTNTDETTDVYEAQLNTIADSSDDAITEWQHGKFYKYHLDLKKTSVKVTATITDWATVTASGNIWF